MHFQGLKNFRKNRAFRQKHPDFVLPEKSILYETFKLDYQAYFDSGREAGRWLLELFRQSSNIPPGKILDWGCGPARIVRHLPVLTGKGCDIFASDFNPDTISWCRHHIPGITFLHNDLDPPISLPANEFSFIYAISVFTHLSAERNERWFKELHRLLIPSGILIFTTQGRSFLPDLGESEKKTFMQGRLVVRENHQEGRRIFSTYHPPEYVINQTADHMEIIRHIVNQRDAGRPEQDLWILRKN